jgi:pimeloyl-ACP methyl ester carboxylesterase
MTTVEQQARSAIRPFRVELPEEALADLRRRLAAMRLPPRELVDDASQGVQSATIQELCRFWAADYDFGRLATRLNALPQFMTEIDGVDIHFIHVRSQHPDALPLIISHGWPGSVIEMLEVIGPLTDPTAHGGSAEDAFDVVVPSLPGYGFSAAPAELGWDTGRIGGVWTELMNRLGYSRYVAQGGDQGAGVTEAMGRLAPDGLLGIHLNFLSSFPLEVLAAIFGGGPGHEGLLKRVGVAIVASRAEREQEALDAVTGLFMRGYIAQMVEHPQTIGYAMAESPAGLAAWMLDHDPDSYAKISRAFLDDQPTGGLTRERVLDNITLYWLTNTTTSAARLYWEFGQVLTAATAGGAPKPPEISVPVAFTVFPDEIFQAPRRWAEKVYPDLSYFHEAERGGHFAAWEEPELFATELRAAFRPLRAPQIPQPRR